MSASVDDRRPAELVASLAAVRNALANAATAAGRDVHSITLIAVTKTFPASDISILLDLGVADIGESRDQEATAKLAQMRASERADRRADGPREPRVHFIGRLQTNKCRSVARYAHTVHTVDRPAVASALAEGVQMAGRDPLPVFVQVSLDGDPARGGVPIVDLAALADQIADEPRLQLQGVMAVAPLLAEPRAAYAELAEISMRLRQTHPNAVAISAGMSNDFATAVTLGSTHVRIGSALLGPRAATFG